MVRGYQIPQRLEVQSVKSITHNFNLGSLVLTLMYNPFRKRLILILTCRGMSGFRVLTRLMSFAPIYSMSMSTRLPGLTKTPETRSTFKCILLTPLYGSRRQATGQSLDEAHYSLSKYVIAQAKKTYGRIDMKYPPQTSQAP